MNSTCILRPNKMSLSFEREYSINELESEEIFSFDANDPQYHPSPRNVHQSQLVKKLKRQDFQMLTDAGRHANTESTKKDGAQMEVYSRDHKPSIAMKSTTIENNSIRDAQRNENVLAGINEKREVHCSWPGCSKSFKVKSALNHHVKYVHKKPRDFQCGKCQKKYPDSY